MHCRDQEWFSSTCSCDILQICRSTRLQFHFWQFYRRCSRIPLQQGRFWCWFCCKSESKFLLTPGHVRMLSYKADLSKVGWGMARWRECLPATAVRFQPGALSALGLLLVLALLRGLFSWFSSFPSSTKPAPEKFHFDQDRGRARNPAKAYMDCPLNIVVNLSFDLFLFISLCHKLKAKKRTRQSRMILWVATVWRCLIVAQLKS